MAGGTGTGENDEDNEGSASHLRRQRALARAAYKESSNIAGPQHLAGRSTCAPGGVASARMHDLRECVVIVRARTVHDVR